MKGSTFNLLRRLIYSPTEQEKSDKRLLKMDTYDANTGTITTANGGSIHLSRVRKTIFDHLLAIRPRHATAEQVAALLYGDSDGPVDEQNTVKVHLHKLAGILSGCTIHLTRPGFHKRQGGYGLEGELLQTNRPISQACPCCGQRMPEYDG